MRVTRRCFRQFDSYCHFFFLFFVFNLKSVQFYKCRRNNFLTNNRGPQKCYSISSLASRTGAAAASSFVSMIGGRRRGEGDGKSHRRAPATRFPLYCPLSKPRLRRALGVWVGDANATDGISVHCEPRLAPLLAAPIDSATPNVHLLPCKSHRVASFPDVRSSAAATSA